MSELQLFPYLLSYQLHLHLFWCWYSILKKLEFLQQSFLEELERTVALLPFEDVSNCPVDDLLDISQRLKTVSEVNAAIITSQSHEKDPKLPSLLKMMIWPRINLMIKLLIPA